MENKENCQKDCSEIKELKKREKNLKFGKKINFDAISKEIINIENQNQPKNLIEIIKKRPFSIFMMLISSFIFSFGISIVLFQSKTIPSGLTAIPTLITYIAPSTAPYFTLMYFGLNLPMFIIFWKKIKKSFLYLTLLWIIFQNLWALFFMIPIGEWGNIHNFFVYHISIKSSWNIDQVLLANDDLLPIIYYSVLGSILVGFSIGIAWKFGGSTGGTDIVSYFYSTKKKKPIGRLLFIISISIAFSSLIIFGSLGAFNIGSGKIYRLFGVQLISTLIYIFMTSSIVNIIYPKYKKVCISIYTTEPEKISAHLKNINYWHSYSIWKGTSGYTGNDIYKVQTITLLLEVKPILRHLKQIDPKIWISLEPVIETTGLFNTSKVE
ncbi:YitT family protein [Mesomycoplasma lagogenitalium]|uniref:YitT family protein n=1 Tax=Mesomycoplasma lagogenitalium TaxID=171286 RepID=A0ABY8LUN3_9BACT|nr:YitT family protein [Mesomycoplasma lagogenitalium]WGI36954.1 YitT family protein [Mesomycoplasma lagogenitalium]